MKDFDDNKVEYEGELDEDGVACGWGFAEITKKHGTAKYYGSYFLDKPEGRGKEY